MPYVSGMRFYEIVLIAVGLAMDAFAVSVCKGLKMSKVDYKYTFIIALFFGVFQAAMPIIGWFAGKQFEAYITSVDHWIAFILLAFIGGKMIYEAIKNEGEGCCDLNTILKKLHCLLLPQVLTRWP